MIWLRKLELFISDLRHLLNSGLLPTEGRKTYDSFYENSNPIKVADLNHV